MATKYRIHEIILKSGERLPLLLHSDGSLPYLPTCYIMTTCRPSNSSSTIMIKLDAIKFLYEWANTCDIDIEKRFESDAMLTLIEIDSLVYSCRLRINDLIENYQFSTKKMNKKKVTAIHRVVDYTTQSKRLIYISHYLRWITDELTKKMHRKHPQYIQIQKNIVQVISWIHNRTPKRKGKTFSRVNPPKGFSLEVQKKILEVIEPDHSQNPWKNEFVQIRNQLYVIICVALGIRVGESLSIKLKDVVRTGENPSLTICRRPDDPEEDRARAPKVKTLERTLRIGPAWCPLVILYLDKYRRRLRRARKHSYLFVSRNGEKLSYASACNIFVTLRRKVEGLPQNLTQHLIRHAWNERFSEQGESLGLSLDEICESRREMMGWSIVSEMPELYNRRYTQKKAAAISLEMQRKFFERMNKI